MKQPNEKITGTDVAFGPKNIGDFLPLMSDIPKEFYDRDNEWNKYICNWFFNGMKEWPVAVEGVHFKQAAAHIRVILGSWEPKHEHKIAGCAYLASLWFKEPK
jgi:hypothetical protein